jgi:signal transduction histidine kinase
MNKLFIKLLSQLSDSIVMFDVTGKVIFSNLETTRFEGIVVANQIANDSIMKEVAEIHRSQTNNIKKVTLNMGEHIENDNHTVLFQNENKFCLYIRDELDKASYKTLRDNMFSLINHELRTPIYSFTGGATIVSNMLKENKGVIKDQDDFQSFVELTINGAKEVTSKMEKLLELAETYGDDPMRNQERINLSKVVYSAIESLRELGESKNIAVTLQKKGDVIGNVYGSFGWLKRAIEECVRNSIEHSNNGSEIHLQLRQNGNFAHITIRDFGRGIVPKAKHTLFDPFSGGGDKDVYSNQGLGIGLNLAKKIIDNHGGNIKNVEVQGGAEFHIELPTGDMKMSSNPVDIRQSQMYAHDLALLIKNDENNDVNVRQSQMYARDLALLIKKEVSNDLDIRQSQMYARDLALLVKKQNKK